MNTIWSTRYEVDLGYEENETDIGTSEWQYWLFSFSIPKTVSKFQTGSKCRTGFEEKRTDVLLSTSEHWLHTIWTRYEHGMECLNDQKRFCSRVVVFDVVSSCSWFFLESTNTILRAHTREWSCPVSWSYRTKLFPNRNMFRNDKRVRSEHKMLQERLDIFLVSHTTILVHQVWHLLV